MTGKDRVSVGTWFDLEVDSNRVVRDYNALPNYVKQAANINIFKNCLDKHRGISSRTKAGPQRT